MVEDRVSSLLRPAELSDDDEADAACMHFESVLGLVQNLTTVARLALDRVSGLEAMVCGQPCVLPHPRACEFRNAVLTTTRLLGQLDLTRLAQEREYAASEEYSSGDTIRESSTRQNEKLRGCLGKIVEVFVFFNLVLAPSENECTKAGC